LRLYSLSFLIRITISPQKIEATGLPA
jgi:hypothetical protein